MENIFGRKIMMNIVTTYDTIILNVKVIMTTIQDGVLAKKATFKACFDYFVYSIIKF